MMREFQLLEHVYASNQSLSPNVQIPPGDDLAQILIGNPSLLAGVDQLVEGRHFNLEVTPLALIGRKAITRSLSDVAAMAGKPLASLIAITLPPDFGEDRATSLFDAMRATAEEFNCPLIGGDIAFHEDPSHAMVCAVTVLATPSRKKAITRDGAHVGDHVYVTGTLGGTLLPNGLGHHLTFTPRIAEALALQSQLGDALHAMIDISDGLGRDASHIATQSEVRIEFDVQAIPCRAGISWQDAVSGGEDYELCFTASGDVPSCVGDTLVTRMGVVVPMDDQASEGTPNVVFRDGDDLIPGDELGWQHES
ncbi:MAG: thiamine-phosphate kinase [Planctomycetota bacterium]|nr:thiamine-phosphate kinase [Planctomycetota bacterium]